MNRNNEPGDLIRVGASACVLGEKVRFDGQHKRDTYVVDVLGNYFEFVPVCPEVEVGMGVPRESVRLVGDPDNPRMVGRKSGKDWTEIMKDFTQKRLKHLEDENLSGYILKKDSPSCGMERVKIYTDRGMPSRKGRGLWGAALTEYFPILPVEEEGRLNDLKLRDNFVVRVFAYNRLNNLFSGRFARKEVIDFHTAHKYLMLAHNPRAYITLGRLVADIKKYNPNEFKSEYSRVFMEGLCYKSTTRKNVNVLLHIMGFLKEHLTKPEKTDILEVIENYRKEIIPLIVPLTLISHYIKKHNIDYILDQVYLNPHPGELMLRNHV